MKKNSLFTKGLSIVLAMLMVLTTGVVGLTPIAVRTNAEVSKDVAQGAPVFSLKWNVPESIYLKPGSGDFQYFLTDTLTATGANADKQAATSASVTVDAPLAKSLSLSYTVEDGKTPAGATASASGISFDIANGVTGTTELETVLTGKKMIGYSNALAGNEYYIKWTLTFEIEVDGETRTLMDNAYTSVYVPFLGQAGSSLHSEYHPFLSSTPPMNWVYTFITGGHSVTGGNYASNFTSSNLAGLETNKALYKDNCGSATFIAPLVQFTGGNPGARGDRGASADVDYPFSAGYTIPWGSAFAKDYSFTAQSNGGVYYAKNADNATKGWDTSGASNLGQLNITVDTSRFTTFAQIPNLKAGFAQFRYSYGGGNNSLRWVGILNSGTNPSYSEENLNKASLKNGIGSGVGFSGANEDDFKSRSIGLFDLALNGDGRIANGVYKILFNYRNSFQDAIGEGQQQNGVVAAVKLNVTEVGKAALRNAVYNAYVSGYGYKSDSGEDVMAYFNAVAAGSKVLADQFATAAEITTALGNINNALKNDVKSTINGYVKFSADKYDRVAFNVPEAVYLNITANASSTYDYKYILDQNMTVEADVDKDTGALTGMHTATITPNATRELTSSAPGKIQFYYAGVDTTKPITLSCSDTNVTFTQLTLDSSTGIYNATLTSGTHAYSSAYINWYVTYTDTVDGYEKSVTAKTQVYAPYLNAVAAIAASTSYKTGGLWTQYSSDWTTIFGIQSIENSTYASIGVNDTDYAGWSRDIDNTCTYKYTLLNHTTTPTVYKGGEAPTTGNLLASDYGSFSDNGDGMGGTSFFYKNKDSTAAQNVDVVGGTGRIVYDTLRYTYIGQIPNFYTHSYLGGYGYKGGNKGDNYSNWAKYYIKNSSGTVTSSSKYNTGSVWSENTVTKVNDPDLSAVAIPENGYFINVIARWWARNGDNKVRATSAVTCHFVGVDKTDLREKVLAAQSLMAKYGVYYNGTAYDSLYYNKNDTKFIAFMNAYDAALTAQARVDAAIGEEINNLTTAIENLETAIANATKDGASAEARAILKPAVAKLYNVSYDDASVDKKLRTIPAFESEKTNEKYNVSFNAKDTVYYSTEDYTGYTFLGFVKSTTDLSAAAINGNAIGGTPSYISASNYKQQPMTASSFGTAAAVGYPSTAPTFTDDNEFHYANTVDPAIYMVGLYQPNHYTIKYDLNEGTGTTPASVAAVYDVTYTAAASTGITRRGYDFVGWNTATDGSGTTYAAGADLVNLTATDNATVTLYAKWEPNDDQTTYTVLYYLKDLSGTGYSQVDTSSAAGIVGDVVTIPTARTGMLYESTDLAEYTTNTDGTISFTLSKNLEIKLYYNRDTFTVTFYGADNTTVVESKDVPAASNVTFTGTNPTKSGFVEDASSKVIEDGYFYYTKGHYSFDGWATTPNATTALTELPAMPAEDVSYYPVFKVVDHSFSLVFSQGTSCTSGAYDTYRCDCGYEYNTAAGPVGQHDFENGTIVSQTAATCTTEGAKTVKCANCDATNNVTINPLGHAPEAVQKVNATCTTDGTEAYYECSRCHAKFEDQAQTKPIEAPKTIPATGHDYSVSKFTWSDDGTTCTATLVCANDGSHKIENGKYTRECTVTVDSTTPADCENAGTKTYKASVSVDVANDKNEKDATFTDTKTVTDPDAPATGHAWGEPTYQWSVDKTTCNAYFVCGNNHAHTKTVACEVTAETTDPTGGNDGYTEYTATVTEDGKTYTSDPPEKVVDEGSAVGYDVTVNYLFADETKAAEPVTRHYAPDETGYSIVSANVPGYTASQTTVSGSFLKTDTTKTFDVIYTANVNTAYTVKHYQQNADGEGYTEVEADRQTLTGTTGADTNAAAKTYTGFTAKSFTQAVIKGDGSTVIDIYYDRDVYTVSWTIGDGATVNDQPTEVRYGNDIDFTVAYGTGYDQVKPAVTVSGGTLTGTYKVTGITGNVTINVPTQKNKYAVTVSGDAGVTVSEGKTVEYLDSYVLTVTAKENYTQTAPTATVNDAALALVKGEGNTYTATIENIAEAKAIVVASTIDSHILTVTYKYADNSTAATTVTKSVSYGASYSETCPTIDKFVPVVVVNDTNVVTNTVEGTMGASDITVNVVYLADENGNGTPDVDDSKLTVTFDYGRYGTAAEGQVYAAKVLPGTAYADVIKPAVTAKDGFTFKGWKDPGVATVDEDITVYAEYTTKDENGDDIIVDENTYLIKFVNYDGTLLKAIAADAGEIISAPADPTRGDFTFAGWTPAVKTIVEGDATYTATFKTAKTEGGEEEVIGANESVVSFYAFDGKLIKAEFVENGNTVTAPEVPDRAGFTKNGWTPAFDAAVAVTKDAAYTASYKTALTEGGEEEVIEAGKYVIKFFTFDGKLIEAFVKAKDETFTAPAVPDRENTTSKYWTPDVVTTVAGDANYTASYKTKLTEDGEETDVPANSFVISFYTYDGKLIERQLVAKNGDVTAPDAPARDNCSFAGWTPAFADKAAADVSYTATYKTKLDPTDTEETVVPDGYCVVTFRNYDGSLVETKLVKKGETTTAPDAPTRANCTFKAWDPAFSETDAVNEDKTYTATYTTKDENGADVDVNAGQFVVKFFNYDNSLLKTFVVDDGEKVTAPTATRGDFTFAGWTPDFNADAAVHADASYKATFKTALVPGGTEQVIPDGFVAVRFLTYKDELIRAEFVPAGSTVPAAPTAPARAQCTFAGWDPAYKNTDTVSVDTDYKATYKTALVPGGEEQLIPEDMFVVRFVDAKDALIAAVFVAKNGTATAPDMDGTADYFDDEGHYGFDKWNKAFDNITADTTVKGEYGFTAHTLADKDVVDADCLVNGSKTVYCTGCGYEKKNVVIPAPGHTIVTDEAVAPSCTGTGLTEGTHCSVCNTVIVAQKPIAATGHTFGKWTLFRAATDTEDGILKRVCSVCTYEETKTYSKSDEYLEIDHSVILPYGESIQIDVYRMPAGTLEDVTWTSENINIAIPDEDGKIMIVGIGEVILTATTADGLTVSKTFYINDSGNTKVVRFVGIDKMSYIIAGYFHVYNIFDFKWAKGADLRFRVNPYSNFPYASYVVRADGIKLAENADGSYTIPGSDKNVIITIEGAAVDQSTGEKLSFWELLVNFFRRIIDFFSNLFK